MQQLILGGARSGKSLLAEQLVAQAQLAKVYIATAQALDGEMQTRIKLHQQQRGQGWQLVEETINLAEVLERYSASKNIILVDCLTLWITNCLLAEDTRVWPQQRQALLDFIAQSSANIVFVSNEVGQGVVPMDALSRQFVDESGRLHQALAKLCQRVVFVTAGLPQVLKGEPLNEINS